MSISMSNVSLTNVVSNAITDCGNLISVMIMSNNFPLLPANFASTCINMTQLYLSQNKIKQLHEDSLKGLTFLTQIFAPNNNISCIPSGLFKHTPVLTFIEFSYNQISEIDPNAFKGLASLSMVGFAYNHIINLPAFDFTGAGLTMGMNLMFSGNSINSISPQFIAKLFTTRYGFSMTNVQLMSPYNSTSCIPTNSFYSQIYNSNWPTANISLSACYANWKEDFQTRPVSCASIGSPETTTKKTEDGDDSSEEQNGRWPFGGKDFFAIITNAMKNFTANVAFQ
jgi:hypothetical protein